MHPLNWKEEEEEEEEHNTRRGVTLPRPETTPPLSGTRLDFEF